MPFTLAPDRRRGAGPGRGARARPAGLPHHPRQSRRRRPRQRGRAGAPAPGAGRRRRHHQPHAYARSRFAFLFEDLPGVDRTREGDPELRRADVIVVLDISDLGRLGMLGETVRTRGVPVACVDHHVSDGVLPDGPRYLDAGRGRHRRAGLRARRRQRLDAHRGGRARTLRRHPHRHRRLPLQQHAPPHASRRRRAARGRGRSRGDLPRGLRPGPRGPPPTLRRGAPDARGGAGVRPRLGHGAARGHRAARRLRRTISTAWWSSRAPSKACGWRSSSAR